MKECIFQIHLVESVISSFHGEGSSRSLDYGESEIEAGYGIGFLGVVAFPQDSALFSGHQIRLRRSALGRSLDRQTRLRPIGWRSCVLVGVLDHGRGKGCHLAQGLRVSRLRTQRQLGKPVPVHPVWVALHN